jgi:hypothetical protein
LKVINLDTYERKARLAAALLSLAPLLVAAETFGVAGHLSAGLHARFVVYGVWAALVIGLSHLASAAGNLAQKRLWPRWPHDSPTNTWLHPTRSPRSGQQRHQWYRALRELTAIDVASVAGDDREVERAINDALAKARVGLRGSPNSKLLHEHNTEYGFARNLLGLSPIPMMISLLSAVWSWWLVHLQAAGLALSLSWTLAWIAISLLGALVFPSYVRRAGDRYAESFFGSLDKVERDAATRDASPSGQGVPSSSS